MACGFVYSAFAGLQIWLSPNIPDPRGSAGDSPRSPVLATPPDYQ
jgi:hypothetical protein